MKILFCAIHFGYFRNFESVIRALAARGHRIHLVAEEPERFGGQELVERLAADYPAGVSWSWTPRQEDEPWFEVGAKLRHGLEYVRFQDPSYDDRPKVRHLAAARAPRVVRWICRGPLARTDKGRRASAAALVTFDRLMPTSAAIEQFLRAQAPDVLLLASLTYSRSQEFEYLKTAHRLGIPTAACIFSWDHLTNKAWIRTPPDRVIVWNESQRQEAIQLHHIRADRVVVTGAQCYDQWFDRWPERSREEFCRAVGLRPERPYLLYVCSVLLRPGPNEAAFVLQWIDRIRSSADPALRNAGILVRPHPERLDDWQAVDLGRFENVSFYGRNPIDTVSKAEYFDSMYHSAAVVGLVTSAFIEAAIVGRPVYTIQLPEFRLHQDGAPHFHYLVHVGGGLLRVAQSFDEHVGHLSDALAGRSDHQQRTGRFLAAFVRPRGLENSATNCFVEAVEDLGGRAPGPVAGHSIALRLLEPLVRRFALAAAGGWARPLMMDAAELGASRTEDENRRRKQEYVRAKEEKERELARIKEDRLRGKEELRREKERRRRQRMRNPRKIVARVKGRVKQLIGLEVR